MKTIYLTLIFGLLMCTTVFGASVLEQNFWSNTISIFGENQILVGLIAMFVFIGAIAATKIPVVIMAPVYMTAFIIISYISTPFRFVSILIAAFAFAIFLISLARGGH
jgi:hypothetical protein